MPDEDIKPIKRDKEDTEKLYNKIGRLYNMIFERFERKHRLRGLEALNINKGDTVLEIGYGTGEAVLILAEKVGEEGKVYGVDISRQMHNITIKKIKEAGMEERVELFCSDGVEFKYEECFFTKIFLSFTLELFCSEEMEKILGNCRAMLKTEGKIGIVSLSRRNNNVAVKFYEWLHKTFPVLLDCRPIYVDKSLKEANFEIVHEELLSLWGLPVAVVVGKKAL